jgi:hypothetical protein
MKGRRRSGASTLRPVVERWADGQSAVCRRSAPVRGGRTLNRGHVKVAQRRRMVEKAQVSCSAGELRSTASRIVRNCAQTGRTCRIALIPYCRLALGDVGPHQRQARIDSLTGRRAVEERDQRRARPDLEVDRAVDAKKGVLWVVHEVRLGLARRALQGGR